MGTGSGERGGGAGDDWTAVALVARLRDGDEEAFGRLYDRYGPPVFAYLSIVLDDPGDADQATEDVFVEVLDELSETEFRSVPFRVWLLKIAHEYAAEINAIADSLRAREESPSPQELGAAATLLQTKRSGRAGDEALLSLISRLPVGPREALILRRMLGFSAGEAAEVLGRSPDQIGLLERNAVNALSEALRPFNGRPPVPPGRLGAQRRVRESPVACGRRLALMPH